MSYKIPESFYYYISADMYFTYDGYFVRDKHGKTRQKNRGKMLRFLTSGNIIYLGEV